MRKPPVVLVAIWIDYQEAAESPLDTYASVVVEVGDQPRRTFFTGDVVKDWQAGLTEALTHGVVIFSRSVDRFVSESAGAYTWEGDPQGHLFLVRRKPDAATTT